MSVTGATSIGGAGPSEGATEVDPNVELESVDSPSTKVQDVEEPSTEVVEGEEPQGGKPGDTEVREDGKLIPKWMRALKKSAPKGKKKAKTDLFELRGRSSV